LKLGGFLGKREGDEIEHKRALLLAEGVEFGENGLLLDKGCLLEQIEFDG